MTLKKLQILLKQIPKGKVTTYGILAKKLGNHPRFVGRLLSKNEPVKAPCYKVVKSDGSLGGYSGEGEIRRKSELLRKDDIEIKNNKIDLKKYIFRF